MSPFRLCFRRVLSFDSSKNLQTLQPYARNRSASCICQDDALCGAGKLLLWNGHRDFAGSKSFHTTCNRPKSLEEWGLPPKTSSEVRLGGYKLVENEVGVYYSRGLPVITVPLPSRDEKCQFTLLPVSNTVGDFLHMLCLEDKGIDRAAVYTADGVRISSMTTIEALMENDFDLIVNDIRYRVATPEKERLSQEQLSTLSDVRNLVAQLYEGLQVEQHQLMKERHLFSRLEKVKQELAPMEERNREMALKSEKKTTVLIWMGLGYMAVQFGVLARLTWWEYSWDIMEPVTYFVTYGTAMAAYAYFALTRQEYLLQDAKDRQFLNYFHKYARQYGLDVDKYNALKEQQSEVEDELRRLRDPLHLKLPQKSLESPLPADFPSEILSPIRRELLSPPKSKEKGRLIM